MALKNENTNLLVINRGLMIIVFGLLALLSMMTYWLAKSMEARPIALPPDLRSGAIIQGNEVYPESVYTFAFAIFQQLNRWRENGTQDYAANIRTLRDYLTPRFRVWLEEDRNRRLTQGELTDRTRGIFIPSDVVFDQKRVRIVDNNVWIVDLEVELIETLEDEPVKKARILYPLRVVRFEVDWERNPWGLALDGFEAPGPRRLRDLLAAR